MIGIQVQKTDIDLVMGSITRLLQVQFNEIQNFKYWLDAKTDTDLEAYGYTAQEVAVIRSAFSDLDQLRLIYQGATPLSASKDFRAFVKQLWGLGDV